MKFHPANIGIIHQDLPLNMPKNIILGKVFIQNHSLVNSSCNDFIFLFRQQRLQFRPALEEIRAKYFREMKKFIGIPNLFKGVSDSGDQQQLIFPAIIDRNASGFITCYKKADILFKRLVDAQAKFKVKWI